MEQITVLSDEVKEALKVVLEYVERFNKSDEEVKVAHAQHFLESVLLKEYNLD